MDSIEEILSRRDRQKSGIQNARNEWVASIDADCLASVNWLEMLFKEMSDSKVAGIGGKLIEKFQEKATDRWRAVHMRQHWWNERKINPMFLFGHSNMFRKSVIQEIGGYNPKYRTNFEDVDISHRIMEKGYQLVYTPDAIVYHLRQDTIYSALKAYWRWTLFDKVEPTDWNKLFVKWKFNAGKSKYFFLTDGKEGKWDLAWLDILMFPYHCCFDWKYFSGKIK